MACRFEVVLEAPNANWAAAVAEDALAEICLWDRKLSRFDPASDISRLNRHAWHRAVRVDGEMLALLSLCQQGTELTGGLFCPLASADLRIELDPIASTVRYTGHDAGQPGNSFGSDPCWWGLNLGAIGKGWALECAATVLREHGVRCALLHGGTSSVVAIGAPPPEGDDDQPRGWRVRVGSELPADVADEHPGALVVGLCDESLSVSAHHGRPGGHVLDPRSGRLVGPGADATNQPRPATSAVVHSSGAWSEIWSTALLLDPGAFPEHSGAVAKHSVPSFAAVGAPGGWRTIHDGRPRRTPISLAHRPHLEGSSDA